MHCDRDTAPDRYFYPRPPRGGRQHALISRCVSAQFLSTPSARRATVVFHDRVHRRDISIHALREEGDAFCVKDGSFLLLFLSTPSARRATLFR